MRAIEIAGAFGLDNLRLTERAPADPGPDQVAISMRAASLNYRDLLMVRGHYDPRQPLPLVPCSDGVGEVVAVGARVRRVAVGDRVVPTFVQGLDARPVPRDGGHLRRTLGGPIDGTLRERMCVPEGDVVRVPDHLTDAQAATLPCAAVTAWSALFGQGALRPGQSVLLQGTGGVSIFALQLAKAAGARVVITSSSDDKLERARALGADHTINYLADPEWGRTARDLTGGVDHVVEVGGTGTLAQSIKAVCSGGTISVIGVLSGASGALAISPILMRNLRLQGVFVGSRRELEDCCRAIAAHRIEPVVDRRFPLEDTRAAFEHLASGAHLGKIVVDLA